MLRKTPRRLGNVETTLPSHPAAFVCHPVRCIRVTHGNKRTDTQGQGRGVITGKCGMTQRGFCPIIHSASCARPLSSPFAHLMPLIQPHLFAFLFFLFPVQPTWWEHPAKLKHLPYSDWSFAHWVIIENGREASHNPPPLFLAAIAREIGSRKHAGLQGSQVTA